LGSLGIKVPSEVSDNYKMNYLTILPAYTNYEDGKDSLFRNVGT